MRRWLHLHFLHFYLQTPLPRRQILWVLIYSGAELSVLGDRQADAYRKVKGMPHALSRSHTSFRFGDSATHSKGTISVCLPIPCNSFLSFSADVVQVYISLLLGLYVLTNFKMNLDFH